jgi:DNA ligase-1
MLTGMRSFAEACERVAATRKKTEKIRILAELFRASPREDAALAAVFLGGRAFPAKEETTLDVGGALLGRAVIAASGADEAALSAAYRRHGDLGAAAYDLFALAGHEGEDRSLAQVEAGLRAIAAARGQAAKLAALGDLFAGAGPLEVKYLVKIITGELRIGLKESLVEEAIAAAFAAPLAAVQRAGMLLGDAGEVLALAADEALDRAKMRLFHAVAPMLATPAESAVSAFEAFPDARVEDKYDGIRAQVHVKGGVARMFSRTLDEVTESFPDLVPELARFAGEAILDGEIVAYREGRALSFAELQKRLGRKKPPKALQREVPVAFIAFDLLYAEGELFLEKPLAERHARLDLLFASRRPTAAPAHGQLALFATEAAPAGAVLRAPVHAATSAASLEALFDEARARGNEGLMIKDAASPYTPGRRGQAWLKLKRELGTLDVVVTAVEYGHGRRAGVLSDYTFAVRDGERLLTIGKAYSGLTDAEIAELTPWFVAHTIEDHGHLRVVEPLLVIEVAFNNMMETRRHSSGLALRFPRIVRVRRDKRVDDIDTLETARALFARQNVTPDPEPS